ncbi:hypothetical protein GXP67_30230 [Rhodocytophaga rosea]|uniref:Uncharacterized protein n=1 Tax=Rhodocytophaga rosea TaxID=2704465 RepID=A0A6C0GRR7_9BACT|nr:hypothetical protein [Rhodocytophaga rosea]QHT70627.1 hypothetical protein GXP67_30230 [Rhodocytophaga rosea]
MKTFVALLVTCLGLLAALASFNSKPTQPNTIDYPKEREQILQVIENESKAFWDKDYEKWAACWVHEPYIRTMGWWKDGGVTVVKGWEERGPEPKGIWMNFRNPTLRM